MAAYASEINRLKALVAKLQRMQFGKSSEKLRAKTERQIQEAQERISALQEEMAETLGEQEAERITMAGLLRVITHSAPVNLHLSSEPNSSFLLLRKREMSTPRCLTVICHFHAR